MTTTFPLKEKLLQFDSKNISSKSKWTTSLIKKIAIPIYYTQFSQIEEVGWFFHIFATFWAKFTTFSLLESLISKISNNFLSQNTFNASYPSHQHLLSYLSISNRAFEAPKEKALKFSTAEFVVSNKFLKLKNIRNFHTTFH